MTQGICIISDCPNPLKGGAHGWCHTHYEYWRRNGTPIPPPRPTAAERFWALVDKTETCWLWTGSTNGRGYGTIYFEGRGVLVHRFAYRLLVGPIPEGLTIDHVKARGCTSTLCVRPDHLEPVTMRENVLRGDTMPAAHAAKTHCPHGHEYTEANTHVYRGMRYCRTCNRDRGRAWRARQREQEQ